MKRRIPCLVDLLLYIGFGNRSFLSLQDNFLRLYTGHMTDPIPYRQNSRLSNLQNNTCIQRNLTLCIQIQLFNILQFFIICYGIARTVHGDHFTSVVSVKVTVLQV